MATWSQPNTREKAALLASLMGSPINKTTAMPILYDLVGSDDFFDYIQQASEDEDLRPLLRCYLRGVIGNLHRSWNIWDEEAIEICKKLAA